MATETKNTKAFYTPKAFGAEIPSDWEIKKLGDIGKIRMCKRVFNHETSEEGDIPFFKIGTFGKEPDAFISTELYENYRKRFSFPKVGDILISAAGTLGRTVVYDGSPAYFQDSNIVWIDNDESSVINRYLFYIYQTIKYESEGGTIQRLYNSIISDAKFLRPPLPEQRAIAQVLSTADAAIHTTEKLIAQKELRKKWLMQQLLTGKKRLLNDELVDMSYELRKVKFGTFAKIKKGKALTSSELIDGDIPVIAGGQTSPYKHNAYTHQNVITISASGAYAGFVAFHKGKIWASDCSVVEELEGKSIVSYLYYVLAFNQGKIYKLQTGGAQPHVYPDDIHNLSLIIHNSLREQTAIAQVLQAADKEISLLKAKAEKLREQKKGLMQQLLTGRKRLEIKEEEGKCI